MMKRIMLVITAVSLVLFAADAFAVVPVIDGTNSVGEWTADLIISGFDVNEATIPDGYDISHIAMKSEFGGAAADDGLYVLIDLYGDPTFTSLDEFAPFDPVFYGTGLDINKDGDFVDAIDRTLDFRATGFTVFDGTGTAISGSPLAAMGGAGGVVEYFIPSGMFGGFPLPEFQTFSLLDNGGGPPDDRTPDVGFDVTIPEPGSMMLLGMGMFGLIATRFRKKKAA